MRGAERVLVAGGGVAGIRASLLLARAGWAVTLLEASPRLGGRTFSFPSPPMGGVELDNGPHVLVGAYREFRSLLREIGTEEAFSHAPSLDLSFLGAGGKIHRLRAPAFLPAPLHLLAGLLTYSAFSPREKVRTALAVSRLTRTREAPAGTVGAWLRSKGLQGRPAAFLLGHLCRAVLNTPVEEASLGLFSAALRETFRGPPSNAALWVPRRSWSRILGDPALDRLRSLGVEVLLGTRLQDVEIGPAGFRKAWTSEGPLAGKALILCLPPWELSGILSPEDLPKGVTSLRPGPMETLYVRVGGGGPVPPPVLGLPAGGRFDFLVRLEGGPWAFLATPSGPGGKERGKSPASLARDALAGLGPWGEGARVEGAARVSWKRALLHQPLEVEALRPGPVTSREGLFLAGDWIATGLPATLESAARSGRAAADAFLKRFGKGVKLRGRLER